MYILEGTWEEVKQHDAELKGRHVRLTVEPEVRPSRGTTALPKTTTKAKVLRGYGMFSGLLSTEEYLREKREETLREDRDLS